MPVSHDGIARYHKNIAVGQNLTGTQLLKFQCVRCKGPLCYAARRAVLAQLWGRHVLHRGPQLVLQKSCK